MVIAGSVNNDFNPSKINGPIVGTGWSPQTERAVVRVQKSQRVVNIQNDVSTMIVSHGFDVYFIVIK